jgi:hypothetical protein
MSERDKKGPGSTSRDERDEGAEPSGAGGVFQSLVERFGAAGARKIIQRKVAKRRASRLAEESARDVQRAAAPGGQAGGADEAQTQAAAAQGVAGAGGPLPHLDAIQQSFGAHDVSHVQAHTDEKAGEAAQQMGAEAFATGDQVAFGGGAPSLHTAAHEAAHVVQQRAGVQLKGGVGSEGDEHERHADAVADRVVQGRSAEDLLDRYGGHATHRFGGGKSLMRKNDGAVQRKVIIGGKEAKVREAPVPAAGRGRSAAVADPASSAAPSPRGRSAAVTASPEPAPAMAGAAPAEAAHADEKKGGENEGDEKKAEEKAGEEKKADDGAFHWLDADKELVGRADRKIGQLAADARTRYFESDDELMRYASGATENIGYVDREKTWVRLSDKALVLGEMHSKTTLSDLVAATGVKKYQYESAPKESALLGAGGDEKKGEGGEKKGAGDEKPGEHAIEEQLPKLAIGLIGVKENLEKAALDARPRAKGLFSKSKWKSEMERAQMDQRQQHLSSGSEDKEGAEKKKVESWSDKWETEHQGARSRGTEGSGPKGRARNLNGALSEPAPDRAYDRSAVEARLTLQALKAMREAKKPGTEKLQKFYADQKALIDQTITQLEQGIGMDKTAMFMSMASGAFALQPLIDLFKEAAQTEFAQSGTTDVSKDKKYGAPGGAAAVETSADGHDMEKLRDSYMLRSIDEGARAGVRLFGVGDNHRKNLARLIKEKVKDAEIKATGEFYAEQYGKHPDK